MYPLNSKVLDILERIQTRLDEDLLGEEGAAGDGGAYNDLDEDEALNMYLDNIVDSLMDKGYSESEAVDFVLDMADDMAAEGVLPPMPDEEALESDVALWLGAAATVGFAHEVLQNA